MQTREINVTNTDTGEMVSADQLVCDNCGHTEFIVYQLSKEHVHLQCTACQQNHCSRQHEEAAKLAAKSKSTEGGFSE